MHKTDEGINPSLVRYVSIGGHGILTPNDFSKYIMTRGIASCTGLTLYFPRSKISVLAHILPNERLHTILVEILHDLGKAGNLERIAEDSPLYYIENGPYSGFSNSYLNEEFLEKRDPDILKQYFPGAVQTDRYSRHNILSDVDAIGMMISQEIGVTTVWGEKYNETTEHKESDFAIRLKHQY